HRFQKAELLKFGDGRLKTGGKRRSGVAVVMVVQLDFPEAVTHELAEDLQNLWLDLVARICPRMLRRASIAVEMTGCEDSITVSPDARELHAPIRFEVIRKKEKNVRRFRGVDHWGFQRLSDVAGEEHVVAPLINTDDCQR